MNSEIESSVNVKGEDDLNETSRKSPISLSAQNINEDASSENSKEIKNEPAEGGLENMQDGISATADKILSSETETEISLSAQNVIEDASSENSKEIKNEPVEDVLVNMEDEISDTADKNEALHSEKTETISEILPSETIEGLSDTQKNLNDIERNSSVANVMVKEEPCSEEIDYGMPIAKTPMHTSSAESFVPLDNFNVSGNQNVNTSYSSLDKFASKSALDEYLDGMATPIAPSTPRLRVKNELALFKPPQPKTIPENNDLNKDGETVETEMCPPPPPPFLSSNSNSDFVADGIATPRISLASMNRLRVKSEFSLPPATPEHSTEAPSEDFFNDLIDTKNQEKEPGEVSPSVTDDASENELIPNDYFDDLLIDKLKEKIDEAQNNDLEVKYSDRLKELERLQSELRRAQEKKERKIRKKQKKSKKKSKKRSRSRSLSPHSKTKERTDDNLASTSYHNRTKRGRMSPSRKEQHSEENILKVTTGFFDIKMEVPANEWDNFSIEPLSNVEEIEQVLTPKQRRDRAIKRATALLSYIKDKSEENPSVFSDFPFVSTVRKLPTSLSYVQQQIYENRSPLHTVNNVQYKFNSHNSRFNMEEWGLAALSPATAKLAKLVGCDAQFIHNKLKTLKIPAKLKKIKQEPNNEAEIEEEELIETTSSLFSNAMTQTDETSEFDMNRKEKGYEIGVQAEPDLYSIGCQTSIETQSLAKDKQKNDDELPIMKLIQDLNENQLMAIHNFAEFIKEPIASSSAMEMYKVQTKIMEIYKISQIPSALDATQPPITNNYAAITRPREQSQLCIQSVKSADGRQYTVNDPRNKSAAYSKRIAYDEAGGSSSSLRYDERYSQHNYAAARPSTSRGYSQTYFNTTNEYDSRYASTSPSTRHHPHNAHNGQSPPTTVKHYGRGGLRR